MTLLSPEAQRSRETAMQAERHWHTTRMQALADAWRAKALADEDWAVERASVYQWCADDLERLIAERTK